MSQIVFQTSRPSRIQPLFPENIELMMEVYQVFRLGSRCFAHAGQILRLLIEGRLLVHDEFTDANNTSLSAHTISPTNLPGTSWNLAKEISSAGSPAADIQTNQARITVNNTGGVVDAGTANVIIETEWTPAASSLNRNTLIARFDSPGNFFAFNVREDNGDIRLLEYVSDTGEELGIRPFTFVEGQTYTLQLACRGATISAYIDGTRVFHFTEATRYSGSTRHGINRNVGSDGTRLDDFKVYTARNIGLREPVFSASFINEPATLSALFDPDIFDRSDFGDNEYRVLAGTGTTLSLYRTADFSTFTLISGDVVPSFDPPGGFSFQDHIVLSNGTFVCYVTENENTAQAGTSVWTGTDLEAMTRQGIVVSEVDCGVFYDEANHTIHIYSEDSENIVGVSSRVISHWTTSDTALLTATQQADAVNLTGLGWVTGDVDVIESNGKYYMFADRTTLHPNYRIAVFESNDLYTWNIVHERLLPDVKGGDICLVWTGSLWEALTEYSGSDESGIGHWRVSLA